jgi:hypothetical protein
MYIKGILTAILIGSATMLPTANGTIMELISNGDFETGDLSDWLQFQNTNAQSVSEGVLRINNTAQGLGSVIKQERIHGGLLTANDNVTLTFDYRGTLGPGAVINLGLFSETTNGPVSQSDRVSITTLDPDPSVWNTYSNTFALGPDVSDGISFEISVATAAITGSEADVYFDNISIMGDVIPEPTSALLIVGSAGALSIIRRNKKYFSNFNKID